MKVLLVLSILIAVTLALPIDDEVKPEIVRNEFVNNFDKGYYFAHETSDGSKREEQADFKYEGGLTVRGSYEFVDDEGEVHKVSYIADEKGYRILEQTR